MNASNSPVSTVAKEGVLLHVMHDGAAFHRAVVPNLLNLMRDLKHGVLLLQLHDLTQFMLVVPFLIGPTPTAKSTVPVI